MATKHKWQRWTHKETVEGQEQDVKRCSACGMDRTRDRGTKSLDLGCSHANCSRDVRRIPRRVPCRGRRSERRGHVDRPPPWRLRR